MASKTWPSFAFLSLLSLPLLFHEVLASSNGQKPSPYEFIKPLQGHKKGDKVKGIQELKKYLQHFGYLNPSLYSSHVEDNNLFDDDMESAVKTYQLNFNLKPTGTLDPETISKMMMPRCGMPDIINGTTRMHLGNKMHHYGPRSFHANYVFPPGGPKWPLSKGVLSYGFKPNTRNDLNSRITYAFTEWNKIFPTFNYILVSDYGSADLKLSFEIGDHGDSGPFDGRWGVLAHATPPTEGILHFDGDENWVMGAVPEAIDIGTVALHEIGHLLGLGHSSVEAAIMWPSVPIGQIKGLNDDDIQGIRALYSN